MTSHERLSEIERLLRLQWWFNGLVTVVILILGAAVARGSDYLDAKKDQQAFSKQEQLYNYYFTVGSYPQDRRQELVAAAQFAFAGSSRQEIVERCVPQKLTDTLYRVNLNDIDWKWKQFFEVAKNYPYLFNPRQHSPPLVMRFDWWVLQLTDTTISDAHYRLLYNDKDPSRNDVLKFWKTNTDPSVHYAIPEGDSKVSVQKKRWVVSQANAIRTYAFGTLDFLAINKKVDPLEQLDYPLKNRFIKPNHDGEEWIFGMPKYSILQRKEGALQAYFLSDQNGKRVEEAPGRLVVSRRAFRNYSTITNNGGCVDCHQQGLNFTSTNEALVLLESGGIISTKDKDAAYDLERLVLRGPDTELKVANELYTTGVSLVTGLETAACVEAFNRTINFYDAPVTLEQAALELYTTPKELTTAMAWYSGSYPLPARLVALTHKNAIPRSSWEEYFYATYKILKQWREAVK